jgi:hypothetical protein
LTRAGIPPPADADVALFQLAEEPEELEEPDPAELECFELEPHAAIARLVVRATAAGAARRQWRRTVGTTDINSPLVTGDAVGRALVGRRDRSGTAVDGSRRHAPGCLRRYLSPPPRRSCNEPVTAM